jgi:hypothetical protein
VQASPICNLLPSLISIQPAIFEDIAQEAVNICRQSLVSAAEIMKGGKSTVSSTPNVSTNFGGRRLDGELFLVRHLLILKEMIQNLDFVNRENTPRSVDLSAVTGKCSSSSTISCIIDTPKQKQLHLCLAELRLTYPTPCLPVLECLEEMKA